MGLGAIDPVLHGFIEAEMARIEQQSIPEQDAQRGDRLSQGCEAWLGKVLEAMANNSQSEAQ